MVLILEHCLAEIDERITFKPTENDEYGCRLHIQNIAHGTSIIFKVILKQNRKTWRSLTFLRVR